MNAYHKQTVLTRNIHKQFQECDLNIMSVFLISVKVEHTRTAAVAVSCSQESKAFTLSFVASSCTVHNWYKSSTTESTAVDVDELD
jgi:hypothetical protein